MLNVGKISIQSRLIFETHGCQKGTSQHGEIDGELEKLGNQLAQLTQQASGEDIPEAELLKLTQQMDGLRQERRQLEGERDIISQAKTRLEELKK